MAKRRTKKFDLGSPGCVGKAVLASIHLSPRRARLVADMVRGLKLDTALDVLRNCETKTGPLMSKLLISAAHNAKDRNQVNADDLYVKKVLVDGVGMMKRFMPRAQGRATPIRKRLSRIIVELDELQSRN